MSRPRKCRRVAYLTEVTYFKPAGVLLRALNKVHTYISKNRGTASERPREAGSRAGGGKDECFKTYLSAGLDFSAIKNS